MNPNYAGYSDLRCGGPPEILPGVENRSQVNEYAYRMKSRRKFGRGGGAFRLSLAIWLQIFASMLSAQSIPPGTALPVMLGSTLNARKLKSGQDISGRLMQDVPLPGGTRIPAGSRVLGKVVEVKSGRGSRLEVTFNRVLVRGHSISVATSLRALASMMAVFEAKLPTNALDDYGTSESDWNTVQVGGDAVYRGNGQVIANDQVVGSADSNGQVMAKLAAVPERGCTGTGVDNERQEALWVFSTSACGAYGFGDLQIVHAGRSEPIGMIALASSGNVNVQGGSGILLRVQSSKPQQAPLIAPPSTFPFVSFVTIWSDPPPPTATIRWSTVWN